MITQNRKATFETFNDGICYFHEIDDDGNAGTVKEKIRFQERTVGIKRYYEAMTAKVQIDRLIRIPYQGWLTSEYLANVEGQLYEIKQVQYIPDSLPKCNDISLHLTRQRRLADGSI
ncbi:MAG: hypothetical protein Q4B70_00990 [Lachnospiraceae bacterium]|nr:hypothetical protein [Lachnospiraceae bacterium]